MYEGIRKPKSGSMTILSWRVWSVSPILQLPSVILIGSDKIVFIGLSATLLVGKSTRLREEEFKHTDALQRFLPGILGAMAHRHPKGVPLSRLLP